MTGQVGDLSHLQHVCVHTGWSSYPVPLAIRLPMAKSTEQRLGLEQGCSSRLGSHGTQQKSYSKGNFYSHVGRASGTKKNGTFQIMFSKTLLKVLFQMNKVFKIYSFVLFGSFWCHFQVNELEISLFVCFMCRPDKQQIISPCIIKITLHCLTVGILVFSLLKIWPHKQYRKLCKSIHLTKNQSSS